MPESSAFAVDVASRRAVPEPLEPDSLTWQDFGSHMFHVMLLQGFTLQVAHPVIEAGVGEHSVYKTDPWGRARRSHEMLWPVIYERPEAAIQNGVALREFHRRIKGVDKHGKRYHALDPEAYGWVHATGFDATVRMHELFGNPLTLAQRQQTFGEWRRLGLILGLREKDLPATEADYWDYFEDMIQNRLIMGDVAADLLSESHYREVPKPPGLKLPDSVWRLLLRGAAPVTRLILVGTLPCSFRTRFEIEWTRRDERRFRIVIGALRTVLRVIPARYRYIKLARDAIDDARRNPQAYRWQHERTGGLAVD